MSVRLSAGERALSRWHRLRYTPLRDVLRGRISGRLDIDQVLRAATLPEELAQLVRSTTLRTRLWPLEKVDVARELAAHFQDGIDAGATPEGLAKSFGNPRQTARLIRRAKLRNRPAAMKATTLMVRSILACFALLIVTYVGLVIRLHTGSPNVTRNFLAELNAPVLAIPEEDRAWPLYQQAFVTLDPFPRAERLDPTDEHWPELVSYVERHADAIELLHLAARKPHLGRVYGTLDELEEDSRETGGVLLAEGIQEPPADENPLFIEILLPELSYFRTAGKMLTVDALIAAGRGQSDRAYRDLETTLMMIRHMSETPFLVSDLVAIAILSQNVDLIGILLRDHAELFSEEQLVELSHRLATVRGGGVLHLHFSAERWAFEDIVQRLYTDDGHADGHLSPGAPEFLASLYDGGGEQFDGMVNGPAGKLFNPALCGLVASRRDMMRKYDELMTATEGEALIPMWERKGSAVEVQIVRLQGSSFEKLRYLLISMLMPVVSRASILTEQATQRRDGALVALACELYRRDHGQWPGSLGELSPHYLPSVPVDRFDGKALRYRLIDGHPVIYSIGADRDDDGGRAPASESGQRRVHEWRPPSVVEALEAEGSPEIPDGDWILWPPAD